jgi:hypothetical protein
MPRAALGRAEPNLGTATGSRCCSSWTFPGSRPALERPCRVPCQRFARNCATRSRVSPHHPTLDSASHLLGRVVSEVMRGVVNHPSINGMQGIRGSNPLSSTPGQRPCLASRSLDPSAPGSRLAASQHPWAAGSRCASSPDDRTKATITSAGPSTSRGRAGRPASSQAGRHRAQPADPASARACGPAASPSSRAGRCSHSPHRRDQRVAMTSRHGLAWTACRWR